MFGWICPRCGTANAPAVLLCLCTPLTVPSLPPMETQPRRNSPWWVPQDDPRTFVVTMA